MIAPCLNCEKRCYKCHSTCEDYISWKKEKREISEKKLKYYDARLDNYLFRESKRDMKRSYGDTRYM